MKNIIYLSAFAFLAFSAATSCQRNKKAKNYNDKSAIDDNYIAFIKATHQGGLMEIKAAKIAQGKSKNSRVLNFAKMMINDHTAADTELKKLVDDKNLVVDSNLTPAHQQTIDSIAKFTGSAFDKAYMQLMVNDHTEVAEIFRDASSSHNKTVKDFAVKTLPVLLTHLDSAKAIKASIK